MLFAAHCAGIRHDVRRRVAPLAPLGSPRLGEARDVSAPAHLRDGHASKLGLACGALRPLHTRHAVDGGVGGKGRGQDGRYKRLLVLGAAQAYHPVALHSASGGVGPQDGGQARCGPRQQERLVRPDWLPAPEPPLAALAERRPALEPRRPAVLPGTRAGRAPAVLHLQMGQQQPATLSATDAAGAHAARLAAVDAAGDGAAERGLLGRAYYHVHVQGGLGGSGQRDDDRYGQGGDAGGGDGGGEPDRSSLPQDAVRVRVRVCVRVS